MKRAMAAVVLAAVAWSGPAGTGEAEAQVFWQEPAPAGPPQFGSQMVGRSEAGGSMVLPIVEEQITVDVDGQHAGTRLRQVFHNRTGDRVEGLYALRAGAGARANGFAYWNGEQKIVGEVFERGVARQVYQNVTRRRRDPGLLEQTGDGAFSFAVSPIEPGERKRVEVSYSQWLPRHAATVELHAPVTRADSEVTVSIWDTRGLRDITSPTHQLDVQRLSNGRYLLRARKANGATPEIVVRYQLADKPWSLTGYIHRDKEQDAYFTVSLAAPELPASATMAKDVTLVIDRSGSMMGEPIRQARAACIDIVKRLRSDDRLNILLFDHQVEKLFTEPKPVSEAIRRQAIEYLQMMDEGGATDLALALEQAMAAQASAGSRPRTVLFFTDGKSAVKPVLDAAQGDKRDVRVFTVGFGAEVNRPLLARLAASKRGRFTYISAASDIEREVSTLYRQIDAPVLIDVSLETEGGAVSRLYPPTIPDLFVDDELRISGRLRTAGPVTFTLKGKQGGHAFSRTIKVEGTAEIKRPWVARQWAGARVEDLLDEIALGGPRAEIQNEVLDLALAYNFTTPYTAFLAIPESEVDWASARQLEGARAYKAEILRRKPDAAHVAGGGNSSSRWSAESGEGSAPRVAAAPSAAPPSAPQAADESPAPMMRHAKKMAMNDEEENPLEGHQGPIKGSTLGSRRDPGGCASCALGGGAADSLAALALASVVMLIAARRRRR
jgi:Ca-activated chloride channel family protein